MLASKIIDQLKPLHAVAYFYMSSGNLHSASDVVTSLLKQLCLPFNIVPDRLKQIFEQKKGEPDYRLQLGDLLTALRETSCSIHQPITIVVDGLDESSIREQDDFVQVFDSLKDTSWKCLVTSRDDCQDTRTSLPRAHDRFSEFTIGDYENERDIYNFVESALRENEPVDRMLDSDPELRSELIQTLTSRAHGMFYWVTLQVRLILDQTHLSGIRNALRSIPGDIREIVKITFRMVKLQDEKRAELAIRALALLTAAQAPLTAEAMCHFLGLAHILDYKERPSELILEEIPNPESITECCMGLIKGEPTTKIVMLAHYDILQEMRKQWDQFFAKEHSARLAITCIAYLSLAEFSKGPCHDSPTFRSRLGTVSFPGLRFTLLGLPCSCGSLIGSREAEISDDILRFLKQPMNLALSLQVSEHNPKGKWKALAMHPHQLPGVSELQIASRHGLATLVQRLLLDMSLDMISKQDSYGRTALHEAAQAGWEDIVGILIKAKADPSTMDYEGKTLFIYAAERGHTKLLSVLDDSQVRSSHDQEKLEDALYEAAEAARTGIVKELLQLGVNPNSERYKTSPMTIASRRGHIGVVRLLLKAGASPSYAKLSSSDRIPLHQAIRNNHVDVAALLLSYGADIEARDSLGRTAIFETLDTPDVRGAALLLKNGIDISCRDDMGDNLLHEAARTGAFEHASSFVDRGIAMSIPNKKGLTPLHLAARHGHSAGDGSHEIASLLVRKGAAINHRDCTGQTPLMYAVSAGNPQLCRMLLEHGASVDTMEVIPEIPPSSAEETGYHRTLQSTVDYSSNINVGTPPLADQSERAGLDHGADIQERGSSSKITPLILAAKAGHTDILQLLLDCGRGTNDSKTALNFAAEAGHVEAVRLLLNFNRARFDEVDKDLETAIVAAGKAGHQETLELLFQARGG